MDGFFIHPFTNKFNGLAPPRALLPYDGYRGLKPANPSRPICASLHCMLGAPLLYAIYVDLKLVEVVVLFAADLSTNAMDVTSRSRRTAPSRALSFAAAPHVAWQCPVPAPMTSIRPHLRLLHGPVAGHARCPPPPLYTSQNSPATVYGVVFSPVGFMEDPNRMYPPNP